MSRKKNRKKNFVKQIAVVNKTPVKQEEQMVQLDLGPRRSVAFIGSECYPFVKTGGLGDVMSALPKTLAKLNLDVKVILPRYKCIPQKFQEKMEYRGSFYMDLCSDGKQYYVGIMEYQKDGVVYDFIDNDEFFSWGNPYTNLIDDIPEFCYFAKASLAALNYLDWTPDIVHCHDWQAALVPLYLRTCFQNTNVGRASAVLTIHNLRFQGIYDRKMIQYWSGLPDYVFNKDCMIQNWLDANMLKGGIAYCNKITTVSNTYAGEIQTEEYGEGLAEHLRYHNNKIRGIVNGIDTDNWNPATDKLLTANYDAESAVVNKKINKNLEQQAEALFHSLFVENANPTWKDGMLSDLGTVVAGGTPSKTKPEYYSEQGIAWITPKDLSLNKSKFISHGEIDISELGFYKSSATKMPTGTVLFSSRAPIGYIAIAANEITTNQGFKSVVPNENVGTSFMYYLLKFLLPTIEGMASGSTFKEISGAGMKSVPVVIPDNETIEKFNAFCTPIFQQQEVLEAENSRLSDIRDALLPMLMSGELDVSDINL